MGGRPLFGEEFAGGGDAACRRAIKRGLVKYSAL